MRVAVIGCGPAGLNAIKSCICENFDVIAFDQNPEVGGEWFSTLAVGQNVHSKIYEGLTTNLPKELMTYSDFPYDASIKSSFLSPDKVLDYFRSYADAFDLRRHIKFCHRIIRVRPLLDKWEILANDLATDSYETFTCDKVLICIGISAPHVPLIDGDSTFRGRVLHSRDYRSTEIFRSEKVLLVGSGASALDMMLDISRVAEQVTWVHRIRETHGTALNLDIPANVVEKKAIERITSGGAQFSDGSADEFSVIVYATGYELSFPFLSVDSQLSVVNKCVHPLYKQCINANIPSLAIIGLPYFALAMPMFELQIKFCLEFWSMRKKLPRREDMLADINEDFRNRSVDIDGNSRKAHYLGLERHERYYDELSDTAGIAAIKPVFAKMFTHVMSHAFDDFRTFRQRCYKVLDDFEFSCDCAAE